MSDNKLRREFLAEFLGTFVLMIFGLAANAQATLGGPEFGSFLTVNFGWGLAVMMGVYVAFSITGAHINPAVTVALAATGRFPWKRVLPYVTAQLSAAFVASALIYLVYRDAILFQTAGRDLAEFPNLAGIWATYPKDFLSMFGGLLDQIVATGLLLLVIMAMLDERTDPLPANLAPPAIGAIVLLIGMTFGFNCGYAINPARDLGPRLFTYVAGWGGQVFTLGNHFWWIPIVGPCLGGIFGVWIYDRLITTWHPAEQEEKE